MERGELHLSEIQQLRRRCFASTTQTRSVCVLSRSPNRAGVPSTPERAKTAQLPLPVRDKIYLTSTGRYPKRSVFFGQQLEPREQVNQIPLKMLRSRSKELCILPPQNLTVALEKEVDFWVSTYGRFVWQHPSGGLEPPRSRHDGTRLGIKINYTIFGSGAFCFAIWGFRRGCQTPSRHL